MYTPFAHVLISIAQQVCTAKCTALTQTRQLPILPPDRGSGSHRSVYVIKTPRIAKGTHERRISYSGKKSEDPQELTA